MDFPMKFSLFTIILLLLLNSSIFASKEQWSMADLAAGLPSVLLRRKRNPVPPSDEITVAGRDSAAKPLNKEMLKSRFPFSQLSKKNVNTLIFPNLDSANITYKLMKELNGTLSIGPILMGLNAPVHILQLGASVQEIVNMAALAVVDAQQKRK